MKRNNSKQATRDAWLGEEKFRPGACGSMHFIDLALPVNRRWIDRLEKVFRISPDYTTPSTK